MSAITAGDSHGNLNGATLVTIVAAPGANVYRAVRFVSIYNKDTVDQAITLYKTVSGTDYVVDKNPAVATGQTWRPVDGSDVIIINGTTESLRAAIGGAPTTTNPQYVVSWIDKS